MFAPTRPLAALFATLLMIAGTPGTAPAQTASEALAAKFGARAIVAQASLSPEGEQVAWIAPIAGQGSVLVVTSVTGDAAPRPILKADGEPERLQGFDWVSEQLLVCVLVALVTVGTEILPYSRLIGE